MKRLSISDASWLAVDSEDTPMHVGNLQIFSLPDDATETFVRDEVANFKNFGQTEEPWSQKLANPSMLGRIIAPAWIEDKDIDMDYHIRHSALPKPGGERELGRLISRLHSNRLDFKRPLWECHIIEGLENNRFAIYTKVHHSVMDGVSGARMIARIWSTDPDERGMAGPWTHQTDAKTERSAQKHGVDAEEAIATVQNAAAEVWEAVKDQASSTPQLVSALTRLARSAVQGRDDLAAPFVGPQSILNKRVQPARRFATQQYSLEQIKRLGKSLDASLNDIVLYLCGSALRRFLLERDCLPEQSLTACIPVSIRPADDEGVGNAISFMVASLATDIADPLKRLDKIKESTQTAKEHLQSLPRNALVQYTILMMTPHLVQQLSGMGGRMRPAFNTVISNVPGPDHALYYNGAKLEAVYPVSLLSNGQALNITCMSYNGSLNFGYTGCRETLPSMQNIAVFSGEALDELDALVSKQNATEANASATATATKPAPAKSAAAKKTAPGKKASTRSTKATQGKTTKTKAAQTKTTQAKAKATRAKSTKAAHAPAS